MKRAVVCGASGFIGGHLVRRLKDDGYYVVAIDRRHPEFRPHGADIFHWNDLRHPHNLLSMIGEADEVYQLAANMGGASFVFSGDNDAEIMHDNALINITVLDSCRQAQVGRIFYSSSACVYPDQDTSELGFTPTELGLYTKHSGMRESDAYPAQPDSDYGFEKLFSERLYESYSRNYAMTVRIARFHNVFGSFGSWTGGREKAPAAICRKVAQAENGTFIDVFGDGEQTRSFLYVDDCVDGTLKLMRSDVQGPLNIGSDQMLSINQLVDTVTEIAGKTLSRHHILGPVGVRGRNSDNTLVKRMIGWEPATPLKDGLTTTYKWIADQVLTSATS